MKIQTVLYYRYLMKQTIIMLCVSFVIALIICLLFLLNNFLAYPFSLIVASLIWLFPLYVIVIQLVWTIKYFVCLKKLENKELLNMMKDSNIRDRVLKSGVKIKYLIPIKEQERNFINAIQPEIEKQKKLLAIKKGQY